MRIEDREMKQLRGKEITLMKVTWGRLVRESLTWELENQMKESYLNLLSPSNFRVQKSFKWRRVEIP